MCFGEFSSDLRSDQSFAANDDDLFIPDRIESISDNAWLCFPVKTFCIKSVLG